MQDAWQRGLALGPGKLGSCERVTVKWALSNMEHNTRRRARCEGRMNVEAMRILCGLLFLFNSLRTQPILVIRTTAIIEIFDKLV
jgi:hypothetical protein